VRPATLADRLAVERSTMSRNLARLEKRSWVQIAERSPTGRSMTVVITDAGREMLIRAEKAWREAQGSLLDSLGDTNVAGVLDTWLHGLTATATDRGRAFQSPGPQVASD